MTDPDFGALLEMASDGVVVIKDPNFIPTLRPSSLGPKYTIAHCAVNKLLFDSFEDKLDLMLPTSLLCELAQDRVPVNFSRLGWAPKSGSRRGRVICDYVHSHLRHGVCTLNSGGRRGRNISTSTHILLNDVISVEHSLMFTLIPDLLNSYIPLSVISIKSSSHSLFCKSYE